MDDIEWKLTILEKVTRIDEKVHEDHILTKQNESDIKELKKDFDRCKKL